MSTSSPSGPPPLRRMIVPALFVGALFVATFLRHPGSPDPGAVWEISGRAMGTTYHVKVVPAPDGALDESRVAATIRAAVDDVDSRMSTYRPDSELMRFNRAGTEAVEVSAALIEVMLEARRVFELTDGAFDVTVGPLVDAWGFGPDSAGNPPSDAAVRRLLETHGMDGIEIDAGSRVLRKLRPEIRCDLSAIAKGYAVDVVASRLAALGLTDFMVEIGGEVAAVGRNADGAVWRIGIERPEAVRREVWAAVELADAAMATSGDYRNYIERDGVRLSHLIDPRIGRPIEHRLASVSVVHQRCMTADALATALSVLGPADGRELVERAHIAALFLIREPNGGFTEWASPAWPGDGKMSDDSGVDLDKERR